MNWAETQNKTPSVYKLLQKEMRSPLNAFIETDWKQAVKEINASQAMAAALVILITDILVFVFER